MMHDEFERIAGYEVRYEDYVNIIEPMYMAVNMSKEDFVKVIDKKRFALRPHTKLLKALRDEATHLYKTCTHYTDYEGQERFDALVQEYQERFDRGAWVKEEMLWSCYYPRELVTSDGRHIQLVDFKLNL